MLAPLLRGKDVYVFGTGKGGLCVLNVLRSEDVKVVGFIDNSAQDDEVFQALPVRRPDTLSAEAPANLAIIIASQTYLSPMEDHLIRLGFIKGLHYFCPLEPLRKVETSTPPATLSKGTQKYNGDFTRIFLDRERHRGVSLTLDETYTLYQGVLATRPLEGCLAEVGVFRGGSARVICEAKGDAPLYLCDTFEGMPALENEKDTRGVWVNTHTSTSLESVREYVGHYPNVHFVKGIFPDSVSMHGDLAMDEQMFKFVHLDVDLYESTLQSLAWFWPRMLSGGWLITHNYNLTYGKWGDTPGVERAFKEYLQEDACRIVEIAETQALIVKP